MVKKDNISKDLEKEIKDRFSELYKVAKEKKEKDIKKWEERLNTKRNPKAPIEGNPFTEEFIKNQIKETKDKSLISYISSVRLEELGTLAHLKSLIDGNKSLLERLIR